MEALSNEPDGKVFRWIFDGDYSVGEYIRHTNTSQIHTILEESQALKQLDMEQYEKLLRIDCADLLSPHKPPATWRLRRAADTNPYTV